MVFSFTYFALNFWSQIGLFDIRKGNLNGLHRGWPLLAALVLSCRQVEHNAFRLHLCKLAQPVAVARNRGEGLHLHWTSLETLVIGPCCQDRKSTRLNSSHLGISY